MARWRCARWRERPRRSFDTLALEDAQELFAWLRELSFVEAGPDGLLPHDLAREVLDADLRWRDPEGYKDLFRRVRGHIYAALESRGGVNSSGPSST